MKTFNSIEELKPYYNERTNTYEFVENGVRMDVEFRFNLVIDSHIYAWNINARDINARDINARDINARNINTRDINVEDINARDINAEDINYYAVCFAYQDITCTSIQGRRDNAKHFVLDGEITIKPKEQPKKKVTLELTDEQLDKIKEMLK